MAWGGGGWRGGDTGTGEKSDAGRTEARDSLLDFVDARRQFDSRNTRGSNAITCMTRPTWQYSVPPRLRTLGAKDDCSAKHIAAYAIEYYVVPCCPL